MYTYFKKETDVGQNLIDDFFSNFDVHSKVNRCRLCAIYGKSMKLYTFALCRKINILSLRLISQRPPRGVHRNWARFRSNKKIFLQNLKCSISMESTSQMEQKILKHHVLKIHW